MVILGTNESNLSPSLEGKDMTMPFIMLILNPIGLSIGQVLIRSMKKMNDMTISCWTNLGQIPFMVSITYLLGQDLSIIKEFSSTDWFCLIGMGIALVLAQKFNFKAM